jgi:hypothetical protein
MRSRAQRSLWTTSQLPFVEIADQHGGDNGLAIEMIEQDPHLVAPLIGPQTKMSRDHPQGSVRHLDRDIQRTAGLAAADGQLHALDSENGKTRQEVSARVEF